MHKVKTYYWYVGLPILAVILGTVIFFKSILGTVEGNPHPQINYLIFILIAAGCAMMWGHVVRMNREARFIEQFYDAVRARDSEESLRSLLAQKRRDCAAVMEIVVDLWGKPMSSVQNAALESELHRYQTHQSRYLSIPQFMSGMMVGLGLLGTFIGLLGALAEIGKLIGAFSMTESGDPSAAIRVLVERLTAPMQAMGVAFSASLFGVLGSLVMGVLLVGVKGCSGELVSLLEARVSYLTDFGESAGLAEDAAAVGEALGALAEHSPVLQGLIVALDQSERRVRELVGGMSQLAARVELSERHQQDVLATLKDNATRDEAVLATLQHTQTELGALAQRWANAVQTEEKIHALLTTQQAHIDQLQQFAAQSFERSQAMNERMVHCINQGQELGNTVSDKLDAVRATFSSTAQTMQSGLSALVDIQNRAAEEVIGRTQASLQEMVKQQHREVESLSITTHNGLRELTDAQRGNAQTVVREMAGSLDRLSVMAESGASRQQTFVAEVGRLHDALNQLANQNVTGISSLLDALRTRFDGMLHEHTAGVANLAGVVGQSLSEQTTALKAVRDSLTESTRGAEEDRRLSLVAINKLEALLQESALRQEQHAASLIRTLAQLREPKAGTSAA